MISFNDLAIVILAAGNSSRMGTSKQLLEINGKTLLEHTVSCALGSRISDITVVLGAHSETHQSVLKGKPLHVIVNTEWNSGMGSTVKFSVRNLIERMVNLQGVLFLVCDQPLLSAAHLNTIIDFYMKKNPPAVASQYRGTYGVPALFDRITFSDLLLIKNNSGAREVLTKMERDLLYVTFEGGEIDLDTPEDYQHYIEEISTNNRNKHEVD